VLQRFFDSITLEYAGTSSSEAMARFRAPVVHQLEFSEPCCRRKGCIAEITAETKVLIHICDGSRRTRSRVDRGCRGSAGDWTQCV
jgi:hypothetical protein